MDTNDIMNKIRLRQEHAIMPPRRNPSEHRPKMLYIGCVDARLDPIKDIGIGRGEALIFRNIGAIVLKDAFGENVSASPLHPDSSEIPSNTSIGAVLEFFLHHIPSEKGEVKHVVISGHTDCGGMKACLQGLQGGHDHYLPLYLESLDGVRKKVMDAAQENGWDNAQALHALEEESVRNSIKNLQTYPAVSKAIKEGKLAIHGWVINTATQRISEMNPETLQFEPMVQQQDIQHGRR